MPLGGPPQAPLGSIRSTPCGAGRLLVELDDAHAAALAGGPAASTQRLQSTHSSRFSATIVTPASPALKMSTGQASSSFFASSESSATCSSSSTSMKIPFSVAHRAERLLDAVGDLVDPLDDRNAGGFEPRDLLGRRVLLALDDRAGVAEAHALHLLVVHELAGHERDDRQSSSRSRSRQSTSSASMRPPGSV